MIMARKATSERASEKRATARAAAVLAAFDRPTVVVWRKVLMIRGVLVTSWRWSTPEPLRRSGLTSTSTWESGRRANVAVVALVSSEPATKPSGTVRQRTRYWAVDDRWWKEEGFTIGAVQLTTAR